jgi:hypothetical protein
MLVCECGNWMHTEGIEEQWSADEDAEWVVRLECRRCAWHVGAVGKSDDAVKLVDRFMWTDDAHHALDRLPPYVQSLVKPEAEAFAGARQQRVMTFALFSQARHGGEVAWEAAAEQRLARVPAPVRAMARQELERTAIDKGQSHVTIALMEEVKARYFGMFASQA